VKSVRKVAEEFRVAIRNIRRDAIETLKKQKKDKEISEDELFKYQDEAQTETDLYIKEIDEVTAHKEKEVMEV
jgi:ribosome recycling factor